MICAPTAPAVPMAAVDAAPKPALNMISLSSHEKHHELVRTKVTCSSGTLSQGKCRTCRHVSCKTGQMNILLFQTYKSVAQICQRLCSFSKQSVFLSKGRRNKKNVKQPIVAWNAAASEPAATPAEVNPETKTQMFKVTIIVTCCSNCQVPK